MVDLIAIEAAVDGLKSTRDIAKTAIELRDATLLQTKITEVNESYQQANECSLIPQLVITGL